MRARLCNTATGLSSGSQTDQIVGEGQIVDVSPIELGDRARNPEWFIPANKSKDKVLRDRVRRQACEEIARRQCWDF